MNDNPHNKAGVLSELLWGGQFRVATASGSAASCGPMYFDGIRSASHFAEKGPLTYSTMQQFCFSIAWWQCRCSMNINEITVMSGWVVHRGPWDQPTSVLNNKGLFIALVTYPICHFLLNWILHLVTDPISTDTNYFHLLSCINFSEVVRAIKAMNKP